MYVRYFCVKCQCPKRQAVEKRYMRGVSKKENEKSKEVTGEKFLRREKMF